MTSTSKPQRILSYHVSVLVEMDGSVDRAFLLTSLMDAVRDLPATWTPRRQVPSPHGGTCDCSLHPQYVTPQEDGVRSGWLFATPEDAQSFHDWLADEFGTEGLVTELSVETSWGEKDDADEPHLN